MTFQEYFAGIFICSRFIQRDDDEVMAFLHTNKYNPRYGVTLRFAIESIGRTERYHEFKRFFCLIDKSGVDLLGFQHSLLRLRIVESFLASTKSSGGGPHRQTIKIVKAVVQSSSSFLKAVEMNRFGHMPLLEFEDMPNVARHFRHDILPFMHAQTLNQGFNTHATKMPDIFLSKV